VQPGGIEGPAGTPAGGAFLVANNLSEGTAATMRTNLALGTMAVQNKTAVDITGGTIVGITDLAVADGGTGASTAGGARTNLGAAPVGPVVSSLLTVSAPDLVLGRNSTAGANQPIQEFACTATGRQLISQANLANVKALLGVGYLSVLTTAINYSVAVTDDLILCNGAGIQIQLPTAVGIAGKVFICKKIDAGAAALIKPTGFELIDGAGGHSLASQWDFVSLVSDGTNWFLI
jgi:hypothetical protein